MKSQQSDGMTEPLDHHLQSNRGRVIPWARELWLVPILVLAALVRFYGSTATALWCDEASSVLLSQYSPALTWFHTAYDVHPPLYFLLLHAWMNLFGDGLFSLRAMSVLPGVGTVALAVWLVRLIATPRAAALAGLLTALLPIAVRYSQEVRMYSLMGLLLMGATIALVYWVKRPQRHRYLLIYALLMTAGFYTHYFTAFCVLTHWVYLLVLRLQTPGNIKLVTRPAWWFANCLIVLLFMPWMPGLIDLLKHLDELKVGGDVGWIDPITRYSLPSMFWQFFILDDGLNLRWPVFALVPLAMLLVAGIVAWRDRSPYKFHVLVAIYSVLPLLVVFLISLAAPLLVERYLMFSSLGLPIILAIALDQLAGHFRVLAIALLISVMGVEAVGLKNVYSTDADQFNVLVDYVNQHYEPGDRIVISDLYWYFSYVYYNRSGIKPKLYTPLLPDGSSSRPNPYGFGTLVYEDAGNIDLDSLGALPVGSGRVWLIGSRDDQPDDFAPIPRDWHKASGLKVGDSQARLYLMDAASNSSVRR